MGKLIDLNRGQTFTFAGHEWITLEHDETAGTTLVLKKDIAKYSSFDRRNNADWRESSVRKFLNIVFLKALEEAAGGQADKILSMVIDLKAADGTFREKSTDRVILLSIEQYRSHRDIIEPIDTVWWTLTRQTVLSDSYILAVRNNGTILYHALANYSHTGIRPALLLSSDLMIGDEGNPDQTAETPQQEPPGQPVEDPGTE